MAALGLLSTFAIGLTIDARRAARCGRGRSNASGNTTAGKGFAIGSAALVSLAIFFCDTPGAIGTAPTTCSSRRLFTSATLFPSC
jgi:hypothetical protein